MYDAYTPKEPIATTPGTAPVAPSTQPVGTHPGASAPEAQGTSPEEPQTPETAQEAFERIFDAIPLTPPSPKAEPTPVGTHPGASAPVQEMPERAPDTHTPQSLPTIFDEDPDYSEPVAPGFLPTRPGVKAPIAVPDIPEGTEGDDEEEY